MASTTADTPDEPSFLDTVANLAPASLARFDAFPKLPRTYRTRSESRGFMTISVVCLAILLVLNDIGEFLWGWPDQEFSVDKNNSPKLEINLDMVVAMPCSFITIDLRDAMGDRLFLSGSLRREGTFFDVGQATKLKEHAKALSVAQAVAQSRKSRGLFSWLFWNNKPSFRPRYNYQSDGSACRITGSLTVKRVTANLHITTIGHGYASYEHVDHNKMNLSHIITEFSFGPFFPEIVQPLDNSYESTDKHFIAYQYYLHVVPTTYIAPRTSPLHTAQYSVTYYTRELSHDGGTPGIFFKFDLDPLALTIHQRTTTFLQLLIRCVGVLGGAFVCMGYAIRVTNRAVEVVTGPDTSGGIVTAESSGVRVGLRAKWAGADLRSRAGKSPKVMPHSPGTPYSAYTGTPVSAAYSPGVTHSPYPASPNPAFPYSPTPYSSNPGSPSGLRSTSATLAPPRSSASASFVQRSASAGSTTFPHSPLASSTFSASPMPTAATFGSSIHDDAGSLTPSSATLNGHRSSDGEEGREEELAPPTPDAGYATFRASSPNPTRIGPVPGGAKKEE